MATQRVQFTKAVKTHAPDFDIELSDQEVRTLADYYDLLMKWNERLHLVAPCSPEEFALRHILESLMLLRHFSRAATVVDVGSGGGLPIIPCLLLRDDLRATLIESSQRKTFFLRQALRHVEPADRVRIVNERLEQISLPASDFLTCRALDRFSQKLPSLIEQAHPNTTALFFTGDTLRKQILSLIPTTTWEIIPHSQKRFLVIASIDEKA